MSTIEVSTIETTSGKIALSLHDGVYAATGIPYAEPLSGLGRIQPPTPRAPWSGVLPCTDFGLAVPQEIAAFMGVGAMGDDCLNLNVWTPSLESSTAGQRAVLVWVHGGGYLTGSSAQPLYHGAALCKEQQVVVVSLNYRVGIAGFACWDQYPELGAASNCGLRDLVLALQWIQQNISRFSGNPQQVTLWGHSAGAMAVATLLAVPAADGLFQRAIMQSGSTDHILQPAEARKVAALLQQEAGDLLALWQHGSWRDVLKLQRRLLTMSLARADYSVADLQFGMPALPCLEAQWLPSLPLRSARQIPLLLGTTQDEWALYLYMPELMGSKPLNRTEPDTQDWIRLIQRGVPAAAEFLQQGYEALMPTATCSARMIAFESDRIFRRSSLALAGQFPETTYVYRMDWKCRGNRSLGACHVVDIPMSFAQEDSPLGQFFTAGTSEARQLGRFIRSAWARFARGEAPDPDWPCYGRQKQVMCLDTERRLQSSPEGERMALWQTLHP